MPKDSQKSFFAIRALNAELASIKDIHSMRHQQHHTENPDSPSVIMLYMRMQWWRDALSEIYGDVVERPQGAVSDLSISCWESPVVRAIYRAHDEHNLTRRFLERLIDAREYDLDKNQYSSLQEAAQYAEDTVSSLLYLSLECVKVRFCLIEAACREKLEFGLLNPW